MTIKYEEMRLKAPAGSPEAELLKWLKNRRDGKSIALFAISSFWMADFQEGKENIVYECWNMLSQQINYLKMRSKVIKEEKLKITEEKMMLLDVNQQTVEREEELQSQSVNQQTVKPEQESGPKKNIRNGNFL